jgi:hypothetical protein
MNDYPRQTLCELIARHGASLCDEPGRCEGLLRDLCPHDRGKVNVLVNALRERVTFDLLNGNASVPVELLIGRLAMRLEQHHGMREEIALWAVESWALALGRITHTPDRGNSRDVGEAATVQGLARGGGGSVRRILDGAAQENGLGFNLDYWRGQCYAKGKGVARDAAEAVRCDRLAAEQGHAQAQFDLAVCYIDGQGVAKDEIEATQWFRKAADQGHAAAQKNFARLQEAKSGSL